jgi:sialate O-acetylesterase
MKLFVSVFCLFALLPLSALSAFADVTASRIFGDHMLLQRDMPLKIWGWADPQEEVRLYSAERIPDHCRRR